MSRSFAVRWFRRLMFTILFLSFAILFLVLPLGGSFIITNGSSRSPRRIMNADEAGLSVLPAEFVSSDGIALKGWWNPGVSSMPVIIFCHGLNQSRIEMLERAAESNKRGYGVLLFDLRNHGESGRAYTTIGIHESRDVCAARSFVEAKAAARPHVLWGVSMGASSAILGAQRCPGVAAIISDSSFLSFRETIGHHVNMIFRLPAFPFGNLITAITEWRAGFDADEGDVEAAVRQTDVPILFIAGGADRRMPPALAQGLMDASHNPTKELLVIPGATHGEAFQKDRLTYLNSVYRFLEHVRYNPASF
jgi:pimeloyl-ACP methyl ester carboxylesterase